MISVEKTVARDLLEIEAVKLNPENPFTWASGWKSPIYCDNRKILSYPGMRYSVCKHLIELIREDYKDVEVIAGVATGAIAYGAIIAHLMDKPFVYVRPKPKDHGLENQVEGFLPAGAKVVVVEDLISTGQSSLSAVQALQKAGAMVLGMVAIFSYNFAVARRSFENANVQLHTLTNYDTLIDEALECDYVKEEQVDFLKKWRFAPDRWEGIKQ